MTDTPRPFNVVNVATGLCFMGLGVLLLLQRAGVLELQQIIDLWPLALVVLGGAVVWQASRGGNAARGSGACAGWLVWVAILGLLFSHAFDRRTEAQQVAEDGRVNVFAAMTGDRRPAQSGPFSGGAVTTLLGGVELDLRQAELAAGETAVLDVFNVLGGTEIQAPAGWHVVIEATVVAGGINDERVTRRTADDSTGDVGGDAAAPPADPAMIPIGAPDSATAAPRLVIQGVVVLGGVTIK